MVPTDLFSLEKHDGAYASWPATSLLFQNGLPTSTRIPGYVLLHEFAVPGGHLLITNYDCPYEEAITLVLLNHKLRILCHRTIGAWYESVWLEDAQPLNDRCLLLELDLETKNSKATIRRWWFPLLRPRIGLRWIRKP
jgi:hypothetical protein